MDTLIWLLLWAFLIVLIIRKSRGKSNQDRPSVWSVGTDVDRKPEEVLKLSPYSYNRRKHIMSPYEAKLFKRLETISNGKYYVFPQIHLSSLVNHQVKNGQDWRAALAKIQRKSVDFVLVDKETLETVYAIELDDRTHDASMSRWERDELVNEILFDSEVPLARLRGINSLTDEQIRSKLISAKQKIKATSEWV